MMDSVPTLGEEYTPFNENVLKKSVYLQYTT